jgi:sulfur-oxidizing protein SoxB
LLPIHFREPSVNIGVGEARGGAPHLTEAAFRAAFGIAAGSPEAYALTSEDFVALAREYGRMGGSIGSRHWSPRSGPSGAPSGWCCSMAGYLAWLVVGVADEGGRHGGLHGAAQARCDGGAFRVHAGQERVQELAGGLGFPFLAGNVTDEWKETVFPPTRMVERGGVRIGIIGQAFPFTPVANPRWMVPDWTFGIQEEMVRRHVADVRAAGRNSVVLLSHNGYDVDRKMAGRVEGIDVILSGHTHDAMPRPELVGRTVLVASGWNGKFLSRLDVEIKGGRMAGWRHRLIPVSSDAIAPDAAMAAKIAEVRAPFVAGLGRELAVSEGLLDRRGNVNGSFDDLIGAAMLEQRDAEIALSPGFRWGPPTLPGETIRAEDVDGRDGDHLSGLLPHDDERGAVARGDGGCGGDSVQSRSYYQQGGDMVRVGGISYVLDPAAPMGSRIRDMVVQRTGAPVEPGRDYAVAGWASINQAMEGRRSGRWWSGISRIIRRSGRMGGSASKSRDIEMTSRMSRRLMLGRGGWPRCARRRRARTRRCRNGAACRARGSISIPYGKPSVHEKAVVRRDVNSVDREPAKLGQLHAAACA